MKCLGRTYAKILRTNADTIEYVDSDAEGCALFSNSASRDHLRARIIDDITRYFDEIFVYHACRTIDPASYYEKGILPLSLAESQSLFRDRFSSYVSQADIDAAIAATSTETIVGVTHAIIDDRCFVESGGHYLIYGSEYHQALLVRLPGASEYTRDILKKFGRATILTCRLAFSEVYGLEHLAARMIADHFYRIAHNLQDVSTIDFSITLRRKIPATSIVRHYCPTRIKDPFKGFVVWNDQQNKYETVPVYR